MHFDQEQEFENVLFDHWFELRAAGKMDEVLSRARSWNRVGHEGRPIGYETCDHRVYRKVRIPGAGPDGGYGFANIVEVYFSVRLEGDWGPNLHINVINLKNKRLQLHDLVQLFRCINIIRVSLQDFYLPIWGDPNNYRHASRHAYVGGALLGPTATDEVLQAEAMLAASWEFPSADLIRVGCITLHPTKGITVERRYSSERFHIPDRYSYSESPQERESMIQTLMGHSSMWAEWRTEIAKDIQMRAARNSSSDTLDSEPGEPGDDEGLANLAPATRH